MDEQGVRSAIDQLLSLNGWVAALCPTLTRPFGQNKYEDAYDDLVREDHLYYIAIVIHSADHFLVDQFAVIVQMAKRLGTNNLFVSMLDYESTDSTETLTDLCEAVLILLGVPFRIRRVPGMTEDPAAAYYPLEEAHMRNLALELLLELKFNRLARVAIAIDRDVQFRGEPDEAVDVVGMFVRDEDAGQPFGRATDGGKPFAGLAGAETGVDEQTGFPGFQVGAIAVGTTAENR